MAVELKTKSILILTQKVDRDDDVLGFFHGWLEKFSQSFTSIEVICLQRGKYDLPANVRVWSLGKETGKARLKYLFRFYRYLLELRGEYDVVFVHMNPIYIVLAGIYWRLTNKKIMLWYNHLKGNFVVRVGIFLSNVVFCTSPFSFAARFSKSQLMPAGINTDVFKKLDSVEQASNSILYLGRISPVKNVDVLIDALRILDAKHVDFILNIVGEPGEKDGEYFKKIKEMSRELEGRGKIKFFGKIANYETPGIYNNNAIFVNLTNSGSFDKTTLEAMACGTLVAVSNESFKNILKKEWLDTMFFIALDSNDLAIKLEKLLNISQDEGKLIGNECRNIVIQRFSLEKMISQMQEFFS